MSGEEGNRPSFKDKAIVQEKSFDWLGAAESYRNDLGTIPKAEPLGTGDILERMAYALYKAALQAEDVEEFTRRAEKATRTYEEAASEYRKHDVPGSRARTSRCEGMLAFIRFIRAATADQKLANLRESWERARECLDAFAELDDGREFCRAFCDLAFGAVYHAHMLPDFLTRKKIWVEMTEQGERALMFARRHEDKVMNIRVLVLTSAILNRGVWFGFYDKSAGEYLEKAMRLWKTAETASREEVLRNLPMAWITGDAPMDPGRDAVRELETFREAADLVRESKDRLAIGHALAGMSFYTNWIGSFHPDKELGDPLMEESLSSALDARREFMKIGFVAETGHNIWVMSPHCEYWLFMAWSEKDLVKVREYAKRGLKAFPEYSALAVSAGYRWHTASNDLLRSMLLQQLARTEPDVGVRRALLEEAVEGAKKSISAYEVLDATCTFNLGVWHGALSDMQEDYAEAIDDRELRARVLREAIDLHKTAIKECESGLASGGQTRDESILSSLGESYGRLGRRYCSLFELEGGVEVIRDALECFEKASEIFARSGFPSKAAETLWQAARVYDQLDDPVRAAERFLSAAKDFRAGAKNIRALRDVFHEQAIYLEAWAEFEKAKRHHSLQDYQQAESHFKKASELHDGLERWRFLASNYRAWSLIDHAEALSKEDMFRESSESFEQAAALFLESEANLGQADKKAGDADEKRMITRLLRTSKPRREYCLARAMIEKARQMDVEGMSSSSSETYKAAADELDRLAAEAPSERDRTDFRVLAVLSRAWQKMNQAEAEVSPEPYAEAAVLFEEVKELSSSDRAKALSLGHSRFCRALEAGTRFMDTREAALHASAVKSLESASAFYVKAGADRCSEYARASKLLFDAYAYLADASQEKEQDKAARTYARAEKVLNASAESYDRAGQAGKRDQVLKLLDRVKRERELAVSLMDVFEAPTGGSSTAAFGAPMPSQEEAVGLDRFAHADIQAALIIKRNDIRIGEDVNIEIELVNAGRASAQLTKVENVIPAGFDVCSKPSTYRIEDSYIIMKGKRLDPLKTEEIALVLRPKVQGRFTVQPRILYIDDLGAYKVREVEGCDITVKELGVKGWLMGPNGKG
jgi:hypothetical protein